MKEIDNSVRLEYDACEMEYDLIMEFVRLRKKANMSQQAVADNSEVIRTTIARVENHMNSPQIKTFLKMLEPLGYTLRIEKIKKK